MKKEETTTARTGWKIWLEKTSQSLKKAWKFANEFDLIEKAKNIRIPRSVKIGGLALLLSGKSLNSHAAETGGRSEDRKIDTTEASVTAAPNRSNDAKTIEFSAVSRANITTKSATVLPVGWPRLMKPTVPVSVKTRAQLPPGMTKAATAALTKSARHTLRNF